MIARAVVQVERRSGGEGCCCHPGRTEPPSTPLATIRVLDDAQLGDRCRRHEASTPSTIPFDKVNRSDPAALHDQVAAQIRRAIADGEAHMGQRLPPARDLAAVLGVNPNTVLKALRVLRDEGLVEFRRGRGIRVAGTPERSAVIAHAHELVTLARDHGLKRDELLAIVQQVP
jgi:GntR family transcriptional regulator